MGRLAGSLSMIGSPVGLLKNVGGGVKSFFYEVMDKHFDGQYNEWGLMNGLVSDLVDSRVSWGLMNGLVSDLVAQLILLVEF